MQVPRFFNLKKQTMRRMLFGYMLLLVLIIFILVFTSMFLFGYYSTARETLSDTLSLQMEVFDREITAHHDTLSMRCISLSEASGKALESYFYKNGIFSNRLSDSPEHLNAAKDELTDILKEEMLRTECSGAFVVLNTASGKSDTSKPGVYIRRDFSDDSLVVFYEDSAFTGAKENYSPEKHEPGFNPALFPEYDRLINKTSETPQEESYYTTGIITIPGTSEKAMMIILPVRSSDGTVLGICGFEINETSFEVYHSQPSTFDNLVCVFSKTQNREIDISKSFTNCTAKSSCLPEGTLKTESFCKKLHTFKNENSEYIGTLRNTGMSHDNARPYTLAVMIPKNDYNKIFFKNFLHFIILTILLLLVSITCCSYFSKRYISPIIKKLEKFKNAETGEETDGATYAEIEDLFAFLKSKEDELSEAQSKVDRLSYSRKSEIDPDDYENFKTGLKMLTKSERNIFDMYLSGKTAKEITEAVGIKERTLKFHNSNIYSKLGVRNLKELLRFAALYNEETEKNM